MPPPLPILFPVAEVYRFSDAGPPWEWSLTPDDVYRHIPLSGDTTLAEVGAIVATEVNSLQLEHGPTAAEWLDALLADGPPTVSGGVVASDGEREIGPSCCCGVKSWREWQLFAADGPSPWMGHDPFAWAEWVGDTARVWSDGLYDRSAERFAIEFTRERFEGELAGVERKLLGFLGRVEEWARSVGFSNPAAVRQVFAADLLGEPTR
jgi:hypothetical protein